MDEMGFDELTRDLSGATSRRVLARLCGGLALGSLFTLGLASVAARNGRKGRGKSKKITICHQGKTIKVSASSWKVHQKHGDTKGSCATQPPQICADGVRNGSESDVDCGGTCPRCATGKTCASRDDCASARCAGGTCQTCDDPLTDCGTDTDGTQCACRDHASGQRFCTRINGTLFPAGTPCSVCQGDEQCYPINGGANGIECILPCGA